MPYEADFQTRADTPEELEKAILDVAGQAVAALRGRAEKLKAGGEYSSQAVFRLRYVEDAPAPDPEKDGGEKP